MSCQVDYKIPKIHSAGKGLDPHSTNDKRTAKMTQCPLFHQRLARSNES